MQRWLNRSRFTAIVSPGSVPRQLRIDQVRLRDSKDYCGQHPGPCVRNTGSAHRHSRCLEGADWVGFNDGLNTVLDLLNVKADVWSYNREAVGNRYVIRRGYLRLAVYQASPFDPVDGQHWLQPTADDYFDCRQRPHHRSEYPDSTPGAATWRKSAARRILV
jgi:hypothetical protein